MIYYFALNSVKFSKTFAVNVNIQLLNVIEERDNTGYKSEETRPLQKIISKSNLFEMGVVVHSGG